MLAISQPWISISSTPMHSASKKKVVFIMGATGTGKNPAPSRSRRPFASWDHQLRQNPRLQGTWHCHQQSLRNGPERGSAPLARGGGPWHRLHGSRLLFACAQGYRHDSEEWEGSDRCQAKKKKVPIVIGGSNSYVEALVEEHFFKFKRQYDSCFLWADVVLPVLNSFGNFQTSWRNGLCRLVVVLVTIITFSLRFPCIAWVYW